MSPLVFRQAKLSAQARAAAAVNVAIGSSVASTTLATGSNNILIGTNPGVDTPSCSSTSNFLNIGNLIYGTGLGTSGTTPTGSVGIGTALPNTNALLQLYSTTKGFLPPLLTTTNETSMGTSLPTGLMVYNTTNNELESFNGTSWEAVGANAADAAGSTGQVQFNSGGDLGADSNFFWDNTNKRLGIGSTLPGARTEIDTGATGTIGLLIKGASGQTANLLNITDVFGNKYLTVGTTQISGLEPIVASDSGIHASVSYDLKIVNTTDIELLDGSNGTIPFYATGAGNVGIGIATPAALLKSWREYLCIGMVDNRHRLCDQRRDLHRYQHSGCGHSDDAGG